jgi:hypothetical protein
MHQNFRAVKTRPAIKDKYSIVVTIPNSLLERYGLSDPTHMILLPVKDGIMMRRFEVGNRDLLKYSSLNRKTRGYVKNV